MRIEPKINESDEERETRIQDEKDDISHMTTQKVTELCCSVSIDDENFQHKYDSKLRCLKTMEKRLQYILFLREFNVICCLRKSDEDERHLSFNQVLNSVCKAITIGRRNAKKEYETAKKAAKLRRINNQLS